LVIRRLPVHVVLAALALAGAAPGCGGDEKDSYVDDYNPLNDRLLTLGESIGRAPLQAGPDSNSRLASRFRSYASQLDDVNRDIAALDTPADLRDESKALTSRIEVVVRDLRKISDAARRGDQQAAAAATLALTDHANEVNAAQNKLARATGADVGPR
jgi:hypothetical protein